MRKIALAVFTAILPLNVAAQTVEPAEATGQVIKTQSEWVQNLQQSMLRSSFGYHTVREELAQNGPWGNLSISVNLTVTPDGTITSATLDKRSGSEALDQAVIASFDGKKLEPFTPDMKNEPLSFVLPVVIVNDKPAPVTKDAEASDEH